MVVVPSFFLYGYNQSAIGGVLGFAPFTKTFPSMNTSTTTGDQKTANARIQGKVLLSIHQIEAK
jgi:hypothetical protein